MDGKQNKSKVDDEKVNSRNSDPSKSENGSPKAPKKGPRITGVIIICATVFIVLYAIVNSDSISSVFSKFVSVMTPIILGFAFAYILNPILKFFETSVFGKLKNKKIRRTLSITLTYLLAALFFVSVILLIFPVLFANISDIASNLDRYIDDTISEINTAIVSFFGSHSVPDELIKKEELVTFVSKFFTESGDAFETVGEYAIEYGKGLIIGVKNFILAIFISLYVLISKDRLSAQTNKIVTAALSAESKEKLYKYVRICDKTFGGFLVGKIIDSLIIGVITFITLAIFNIPHYALVSVIVGITNVIPVFGPFIGAIPSFFIIFIVDPTKALIFLVLILIIQQLDGNVIGPKILGNTTGLSALGVMVAIIIMGDYFGIVGMILGVPIFSVTLTLINEIAESRLKKKNLPLNTAEYYPENTPIDPHEPRVTLSHRFYAWIGHLFMKLFRLIFGRSRKAKDGASPENTEKQEEQKKEDDTNE